MYKNHYQLVGYMCSVVTSWTYSTFFSRCVAVNSGFKVSVSFPPIMLHSKDSDSEMLMLSVRLYELNTVYTVYK